MNRGKIHEVRRGRCELLSIVECGEVSTGSGSDRVVRHRNRQLEVMSDGSKETEVLSRANRDTEARLPTKMPRHDIAAFQIT